jgi:hypothetical protein
MMFHRDSCPAGPLGPLGGECNCPHYMLPGSHERANGPECRCGWGWDRFNDRCLSGTTSPADSSLT